MFQNSKQNIEVKTLFFQSHWAYYYPKFKVPFKMLFETVFISQE